MAQIHNALTRGPWTKALKAALGDSRSEGGVERFGETLDPIIDLWSRPEWAYLLDDVLWSRLVGQVAVVGEFSFCAVANPSTSNRIITVTAAVAGSSSAGTFVTLGVNTRDTVSLTATQAVTLARDFRTPGGDLLTVPEFWFGSDVANLVANQLDQLSFPTNVYAPFLLGVPYILVPGRALIATTSGTNQAITAGFAGFSRRAFRGELSP